MTRSPFDPGKMQFRSGLFAPQQAEKPLTVTQLATLVDRSLRETLPRTIRLTGEISGFRERTHWYFDLKDASSIISCVMFSSAARRSGQAPAPGTAVVVTGRVEFFPPQGRIQFMVERLELVGAGALDEQFKRLVEEIRALGWLAPQRKRRLPAFPSRIAVITSRSGAALQDVLETLRARCPWVDVEFLDTRVQGDGAPADIAAAVDLVSSLAQARRIDTVILTRGGGSKEDLWAFNDRDVARAIVECSIPVIAAIGHETDTSLAELVADERAATPTQAAMKAAPDKNALSEQTRVLAGRLRAACARRCRAADDRLRAAGRRPSLADPSVFIRSAGERLRRACEVAHAAIQRRLASSTRTVEHLSAHLERHRPTILYTRRQERLSTAHARLVTAIRERCSPAPIDHLSSILKSAAEACLKAAGQRSEAAARNLELVGPVAVLQRGFSVTARADGTLIRNPADVQPGDLIRTRFAAGSIESTVASGTSPDAPLRASTLSARKATRRRGANHEPPPSNQMDLFRP